MIRRLIACILLCWVASPALADTAAGVAAYEGGDYANALKLLKPEAEKGDAVAQVKYGLMFAKGLGVSRNPAEAVPWFRKSAEQGNAEGQYALGVAYDVGDTGGIDRSQALVWYRKSAAQGFARAQYNLGHLLLTEGKPDQQEEGAGWVLKAAEQEMPEAMHVYGNSCAGGLGVEQNLLCARYWLSAAVAKGATKAKDSLARVESAIRELEANGAPRTAGGDGSSAGRAIVLPEVASEIDGVRAEHLVTRYYFRGWKWQGQGLNTTGPHPLDAIDLVRDDGAKRTIYFDIVNWFGKLE
jgi:TPR repeat protein